jgi:hypothetical protein
MFLINVGCGSIYHNAWINLDVYPSSPGVRRWDIRKGIPFPEGQADAVYASHVIEHLSRSDAMRLAKECRRALRSDGVIRLVVPDLEAIVSHYLRLLAQAKSMQAQVDGDYDWILLELLDQMVRTESGGDMFRYLTSGKVSNPAFVVARVGIEAERLMKEEGTALQHRVSPNAGWGHYWMRLREKAAIQLCACLLGRESKQAIQHALLRHSGQLHLWMYDQFSLHRFLQEAGFVDIRRCDATESRIPDFATYNLDTDGGRVRKPDSLFMEAVKS